MYNQLSRVGTKSVPTLHGYNSMITAAPVICLDGPSGVGKGTICLAVAGHLGWHILDSGSLYRITALQFSRLFPDMAANAVDEAQLVEMASNLSVIYQQINNELVILLNDEDITQLIRHEKMGEKASQIAVFPAVRDALLARQRAFLQAPGLVADGRDMGTVVFPESVLKIYLTASPEERAKRRYKQLKDKGIDVNLFALVEELRVRDDRDMNRKAAPLKPASDAIIIDTSTLNIEQVTDEVMHWVDQRV
jgi:cytidylate kinase